MKFIFLFLLAFNANAHWVSRCGLKCVEYSVRSCKEFRIVCYGDNKKNINRVLLHLVSLIVTADSDQEKEILKDAERLLMDCKH